MSHTYLKHLFSGHRFMCGDGGEGGDGGGGDGPDAGSLGGGGPGAADAGSDVGNDADSGGYGADYGGNLGGGGPGAADAAAGTADDGGGFSDFADMSTPDDFAGTADASGSAYQGTPTAPPNQQIGLTSAQVEQALANFDNQKAGLSVSPAGLAAAGVQDTSLGKGIGTVAGTLSGVPFGGMIGGLIGSAIAGNQPSAMNGPALVGDNGVGPSQGQSTEGNYAGFNSSGDQPSGEGGDGPSGLIGSQTTTAAPTAPAAPDVNYNLYGNLSMGGWSSAARKMAAANRNGGRL